MKRLTWTLLTPLVVTLAVTCLVAERPAVKKDSARVAFDMSPPLGSMEQFIPDKQVVIHPAVQSQPERQGPTEGPGTGLGKTPPTPAPGTAAPRPGGRTARAAQVPLMPPIAPEINGAGAAVEQTTQGRRPPIEPIASFDGLGEALRAESFPARATLPTPTELGAMGDAAALTSVWRWVPTISSRS